MKITKGDFCITISGRDEPSYKKYYIDDGKYEAKDFLLCHDWMKQNKIKPVGNAVRRLGMHCARYCKAHDIQIPREQGINLYPPDVIECMYKTHM